MSDLNAILAGTVDEVGNALAALSHDELVELRSLENADKKRKGVLTAIAAALEALATATYDDPNAPASDAAADDAAGGLVSEGDAGNAADDGTATIDPMAVVEDVAPVAEDLRPAVEETPAPTPEPAPTIEHHHPAVDSDFRAGTTEVMNRIDFNDPYQAGRQVVEAALAPSSEG